MQVKKAVSNHRFFIFPNPDKPEKLSRAKPQSAQRESKTLWF
jgi:hypothetical protein